MLRDLILTMPGYVDATDPTDQAVFDWVNGLITVWIDVPWLELGKWLSTFDQAIKFKIGADEVTNTDAIRNACLLALVPLNIAGAIHTSDQQVRDDLQKLVAPGIITVPARDALVALAQIQVTRWRDHGLSQVLFADIPRARA